MQKESTKLTLNQETLRNLTQQQSNFMIKTYESCYVSNCKLACTPAAG